MKRCYEWSDGMAKQIEGVYERVLECAKKEFLTKGFLEASLRDIAKEAGTSTGSIYTRFGDKEGLFRALVEPVAQEMKQIFLQIQEKFHQLEKEEQEEYMPQYSSDGMDIILDFMYEHFDEFRLLLDHAYGTKFQYFVEELVNIEVEYTYKYMEAIGYETVKSGAVTEEFLHIATSGYFNAMFEVVRHQMKKVDAIYYINMLKKYHMAGFDTIFYPENYS